jgi:hypothetical protein
MFEIAPGNHTFFVFENDVKKKRFDVKGVKAERTTEVGDVKLKAKEEDGPGFGSPLALLVLVVACSLMWKRRRRI